MVTALTRALAAIVFTGASLGAQPPATGLPGQVAHPIVTAGLGRGDPAGFQHGSWTKGPGWYSFTVCASGCDITAQPGDVFSIKMEVWGAGGAGGAGRSRNCLGSCEQNPWAPPYRRGTSGGGGGGGGGYSVVNETVRLHPATGRAGYSVNVGVGGGRLPSAFALYGTPVSSGGGTSMVKGRADSVVVIALGGATGQSGEAFGPAGPGGAGGTGSTGSGGNGGNSAAVASGICSGSGGGQGGNGSGPGAINGGGSGGHGAYFNGFVSATKNCTAESMHNGLTAGAVGANGLVKFTW